MRFEHQSGDQASQKQMAGISEHRLTSEQLQMLLNDAIARHGQAERMREHPASAPHTLAEAFEIARQLDIPEEHVIQSVQAMTWKLRLSEQRKAVRRRRRTLFFVSLAALGWGSFCILLSGMGLEGLVLVLMMAGASGVFAWTWLRAPVTDAEAERVELPPQPGICRVCGMPAQNERSTFCTAHQYQVPHGSRGRRWGS